MNFKKILNFKVHLLHIWLTSMMRASSLHSVFKNTLLRIIQCMNVLTLDLINLSDNNNSSEYDVGIANIVITCFSIHHTHISYKLESIDKTRGLYYFRARRLLCLQTKVCSTLREFIEHSNVRNRNVLVVQNQDCLTVNLIRIWLKTLSILTPDSWL